MSSDLSDQEINTKFVKTVEQYPCLYNFELASYTRKDMTDKAWEDVSKTMNMTPSACRERWRNLRAVFMRTIKTPRKGERKKPYYLAEVMQFVVPFMRPSVGSERIKNKKYYKKDFEEPVAEQPIKIEHLTENDDLEITTARKRLIHDIDDAVHTSTKMKTTVPLTASTMALENEAVKSFLNSLLPELNEMNSFQFKAFKRRVLLLIDDITGEIPSTSSTHENEEYFM